MITNATTAKRKTRRKLLKRYLSWIRGSMTAEPGEEPQRRPLEQRLLAGGFFQQHKRERTERNIGRPHGQKRRHETAVRQLLAADQAHVVNEEEQDAQSNRHVHARA